MCDSNIICVLITNVHWIFQVKLIYCFRLPSRVLLDMHQSTRIADLILNQIWPRTTQSAINTQGQEAFRLTFCGFATLIAKRPYSTRMGRGLQSILKNKKYSTWRFANSILNQSQYERLLPATISTQEQEVFHLAFHKFGIPIIKSTFLTCDLIGIYYSSKSSFLYTDSILFQSLLLRLLIHTNSSNTQSKPEFCGFDTAIISKSYLYNSSRRLSTLKTCCCCQQM